jgi:hypothetical protein
MKYTLAEINIITTNMEKYGGSFASALAIAMQKADQNNLRTIVNAFPDIMEEYLNFGK